MLIRSMGPQVIRADGLLVSDLLQAIIPLFELDSYAPPLVMMAAAGGALTILKQTQQQVLAAHIAVPQGPSLRRCTNQKLPGFSLIGNCCQISHLTQWILSMATSEYTGPCFHLFSDVTEISFAFCEKHARIALHTPMYAPGCT